MDLQRTRIAKRREFRLSRKPQQGGIAFYLLGVLGGILYLLHHQGYLLLPDPNEEAFAFWAAIGIALIGGWFAASWMASKLFPVTILREKGLRYSPLPELLLRIPVVLITGGVVAAIVLGVWGTGKWYVYLMAGILALPFAYLAMRSLILGGKRLSQLLRFGSSRLEIIPPVPSMGEPFDARLMEHQMKEGSTPVTLIFRNISERYVHQGSKKKGANIRPLINHEEQHQVPLDALMAEGFRLTIPKEYVLPTHYDPYQPDYWEIELLINEKQFMARFLIPVISQEPADAIRN